MKALPLFLLVSCLLSAGCGLPVQVGVVGEYGTYGYSSREGVTIDVRADGK